jgi:hypothetical protein
MPRTAMTVTDISRAGVAVPAEQTVDVANGNYVPNDGKVVLLVRNSNGAATSRTLTIAVNGSIDGQPVTSRSYSIAAGASRYLGTFDTTNYGTQLNINGDNTDLKVSPLRIP